MSAVKIQFGPPLSIISLSLAYGLCHVDPLFILQKVNFSRSRRLVACWVSGTFSEFCRQIGSLRKQQKPVSQSSLWPCFSTVHRTPLPVEYYRVRSPLTPVSIASPSFALKSRRRNAARCVDGMACRRCHRSASRGRSAARVGRRKGKVPACQ